MVNPPEHINLNDKTEQARDFHSRSNKARFLNSLEQKARTQSLQWPTLEQLTTSWQATVGPTQLPTTTLQMR